MNKDVFYRTVSPYSMTSVERIHCLYESLEYLRNKKIEGDFVECGVWKGGNVLGMASYIHYYNLNKRVWAYDTFSGMTNPENMDVDLNQVKAHEIVNHPQFKCMSPLEEVKGNIKDFLNYVNLIQGDVSDTLLVSKNKPAKISMLRLDTDWYKSTKIELEQLYPLLSNGGVLIVDDYGHWQGARKAVDEFFSNKSVSIEKIDYTGIKIVKD